jgi:hypothetical protein
MPTWAAIMLGAYVTGAVATFAWGVSYVNEVSCWMDIDRWERRAGYGVAIFVSAFWPVYWPMRIFFS